MLSESSSKSDTQQSQHIFSDKHAHEGHTSLGLHLSTVRPHKINTSKHHIQWTKGWGSVAKGDYVDLCTIYLQVKCQGKNPIEQ
jgi:hypothetical protein